MAEETKTQPVEEPTEIKGAEKGAEETPTQPETQVDVDALVQTLDKIGVKDPQHLEGLARTAQSYGPTSQELGQARQQIENLQQEIQALKQGRGNYSQSGMDDPYADGQPIDLRSEIRAVLGPELRNFYQNEVIKPQQEASEAYWRDVEGAEGSEYYPMVQEEYETHIRTPAVQRALSQGKTTHTQELYKLVGKRFKDIGQQLKTAAATLKEAGPQGKQPVHQETGQIPPERQPQGEEARRQQLGEVQKRAKGTDDDVRDMLNVLIPDGDPLINIE